MVGGRRLQPPLFSLVELGVDQGLDRIDGRGFVLAVGLDDDAGAPAGSEEEDAEDRLAVDFLVALLNLDVRAEARCHVDQLRRRPRMETEFVLDLESALDQHDTPAREGCAPRRAALLRFTSRRVTDSPHSVLSPGGRRPRGWLSSPSRS